MKAALTDVSVVVPAYRSATTLTTTLASIAAQTCRPREVIVVDDGSDDGTFDVACAMSEKMHDIDLRIVRQPHLGAGAARNRALRESSCKVIAFLDADDEWLPEKLERSLAIMAETGSDIVSHDYIAVGDDREWRVDCTRHFNRHPDPFVGQFLRGYISSTTVVAKRDAIFAAGGFDECLPSGQDYELWLAILSQSGVRFTMFPEALSRYRVSYHGITGRVTSRRDCSMSALERFAPLVRARRDGGLMDVVMRAVIVHVQAARARNEMNQPVHAMAELARVPFAAFRALMAAYRPIRRRRDFLGSVGPPAGSKADRESNPFLAIRHEAALLESDPQRRNRHWWERMPMTYTDFHADERLPTTTAEFVGLKDKVLRNGPWLDAWFTDHRFDSHRVLDLGCGSGVFSCILAGLGAAVTAVDITETAVKLTNACVEANQMKIQIARMDGERLAFATEYFDFVFSWGVLHHTTHIEIAIKEVARVLKQGGRGIVMVYHRHSIVYILHGMFWLVVRGKIFAGHTLESVQDCYTDGYYHRYLTRAELTRLLRGSGLALVRVTVTQYRKKILPLIPDALDRWLKARYGMCLIAEFVKDDLEAGFQDKNSIRPIIKGRVWISALAWLWVIGVLGAYLENFRGVLPKIIQLIKVTLGIVD